MNYDQLKIECSGKFVSYQFGIARKEIMFDETMQCWDILHCTGGEITRHSEVEFLDTTVAKTLVTNEIPQDEDLREAAFSFLVGELQLLSIEELGVVKNVAEELLKSKQSKEAKTESEAKND